MTDRNIQQKLTVNVIFTNLATQYQDNGKRNLDDQTPEKGDNRQK